MLRRQLQYLHGREALEAVRSVFVGNDTWHGNNARGAESGGLESDPQLLMTVRLKDMGRLTLHRKRNESLTVIGQKLSFRESGPANSLIPYNFVCFRFKAFYSQSQNASKETCAKGCVQSC